MRNDKTPDEIGTENPLKVITGGKAKTVDRDGVKGVDGLTNKQRAFVREMLKGAGSQSAAYREAYDAGGMSDQAVYNEASKLMRHPVIASRLEAGFKAQERQAVHSGASLRQHIAKELFSLTTDPVDADGVAIPGKERKDADKIAALRQLGSLAHVGAFVERTAQADEFEQLDEEAMLVEIERRLKAAFENLDPASQD